MNFTQVAGSVGANGKISPELPGDPTLDIQRATDIRSISGPGTIGINDMSRRNPLQIPGGGSTNVDYQAELEDFSDEEDSDEDDEEPLII